MLYNILPAVVDIIKTAIPEFQYVGIAAPAEVNYILRVDQIPSCLIYPENETVRDGVWANAETRYYPLTIRIVAASVRINEYRTGTKNIYKLTERLLLALSKNKQLDGLVSGLERNEPIRELPTFSNGITSAVSREIPLRYYAWFDNQGPANNEAYSETDLQIVN